MAQVSPTQSGNKRQLIGVAAAAFFFVWVTISRGSWPEIYTFWMSVGDSATKQTIDVPLQLDDDVMIVMRAGQILLERGIPALNEVDVAQPSTSYFAPYLAALLLLLLPPNIAVAGFALVGFVSALLTMIILVIFARSTVAAVVMVILLTLTSTNLQFALNGWDHLFQGAMFALATAMVMTATGRFSSGRLLSIAVLLGIGTVTRLDGALIALSLMVTVSVLDRRLRHFVTHLALPFIVIVGATLAMNVVQFGHLTPTTYRLKVGASPSLAYSVGYLYDNTIASYSAGTLLIFLTLMTLVSARTLGLAYVLPVTAATTATAVVAFVNSDVFAAGRMYWVPTVVMACTLLARMPTGVEPTHQGSVVTHSPSSSDDQQPLTRAPSRTALAVVGLFIAALLLSASLTGLERATLGNEGLATREAQNFALAEWINQNLQPSDGAIGVFYAGSSFHMPEHDVADFLGKGDEIIATLPAKLGAPGHNKWDFAATLEKWNPQAIITPDNKDPTDAFLYEQAQDIVSSNPVDRDFVFGYALMVDPQIRKNYLWCKVVDFPNVGPQGANLGLLLRSDIVEDREWGPQCAQLWPPPGPIPADQERS